jgi:glutathione S-transferase
MISAGLEIILRRRNEFMALPRLIYFSSRGRAELIRLLLAEAGVEYEEEGVGPYHSTNKSQEFRALKDSGKLPFDALPLWQEPDGFTLAQSEAIVRYLARKHGRYGADLRESALCDMVMEGVKDLISDVSKIWSVEPGKRAELRARLDQEIVPHWLGALERIVARNPSGFAAGNAVTCADLALFLLVERLTGYGLATGLTTCPKMVALAERVRSLPRVAAYLSNPARYPLQLLPA